MAHTIVSLLNKAFTDYSSNTALICSDNKKLSYQQVRERAARLATYLSKKGVKDGATVAILMGRSTDYVIATVACMLFGYGFIPLDTEYPKERIDAIINDAKPSFVVTEADFSASIKEDPKEEVNYEIAPDNPAYIVFTSGSTGKPKGIVHDQLSVASEIERNRDAFGLAKNDIWGSAALFTFVALMLEVPTVFASGSSLTIIPRDIVKDPELLSAYIAEKGITSTIIPPRILRFFRKTGDSLRLVVTGTEKVCDVKPGDFRLVSIYGQSETCGPCVLQEVDKHYDVVPVGKPLGNVGLYILDERNKEVEEGEICLSGHFMTGYLNLKEQTEKVLKKKALQG